MEFQDEDKLIREILKGERLHVNTAGIVTLPNDDGRATILLSMANNEGNLYCAPLSRDVALTLGEMLLRAVDAIDDGLVKKPK